MPGLITTVGGVKYATVREASELTGVSPLTIRAWMASGAADTIDRCGRTLVRVGAVRYLRNTPAKQTRAEGITRVSPAKRAAAKRFFNRAQGATQEQASRAYQIWEATEEGRAIDMPAGSITDQALALGRSYAAVMSRRAYIRKLDRETAAA